MNLFKLMVNHNMCDSTINPTGLSQTDGHTQIHIYVLLYCQPNCTRGLFKLMGIHIYVLLYCQPN